MCWTQQVAEIYLRSHGDGLDCGVSQSVSVLPLECSILCRYSLQLVLSNSQVLRCSLWSVKF